MKWTSGPPRSYISHKYDDLGLYQEDSQQYCDKASNMSSTSDSRTSNAYLPVPNPTTPYWRTELHPLDSHRSTEYLPTECDVLIIGAGISGVSVAYHLSQPDATVDKSAAVPSILLLEARQVCSGATGRNGGHVKAKTRSVLKVAERDGLQQAEKLVAFVGANIDTFKNVVERERLDCEFELRRSYDAYMNEKEAASMRESWAQHATRGEYWMQPRQLVDINLAEPVSGVKGARVAVSSPACSLVGDISSCGCFCIENLYKLPFTP
ncbi:hypothetical protein CHU98_g531 [Xylaria longipes]|nr:hypothetical protein CHU98_g531 [Xylaria longipes]